MKKIFGYISIVLLALLTLTSCSKNTVDKLYDNLEKDNVYKLVTVDEFKDIRTKSSDVVYLFFGSHKDNFDSSSAILTIQQQAKQYNIEVVYYIDATEFDSPAKRSEAAKSIGINDCSKVPTLAAFNCQDNEVEGGTYTFDTSKDVFARHFKTSEGKMDYVGLAGFMFRDKCNKAELPKL